MKYLRFFVSAAVAAIPLFAAVKSFAQGQQFVPITLDMPKANELIDEVPMTQATRSAIIKLINRWEQEAVAAKAAAAPPPPPPQPAENPK
jgi:hypothetical protein